MSTTDVALPAANGISRFHRLLALTGTAAGLIGLSIGFVQYDLHTQFNYERGVELVIMLSMLAAAGLALALLLRRSLALGLGASFLIATITLLGLSATAAALLLALTALAASLKLLDQPERPSGLPLALHLLCGLSLIAMAIGWTAPLPLHYRPLYLGLALLLIGNQRRALAALLGRSLTAFEAAAGGQRWLAALAILTLSGTAMTAWLPSLMFDDLGYHHGLPAQLAALGYYRMDAASQVWAFAPWLADCTLAFAQVLADSDPRGPVNLLWLSAAAAMLYQLTLRLYPGHTAAAWMAVMLCLSQPVYSVLVFGLQTELVSTALLLAAVLTLLDDPAATPMRVRYRLFVVLVAGLALTKTSMLPFALVLLLWFGWRWRVVLSWRDRALLLPAVLVLGGSAYFYAWSFTGNPILPLANGFFQSPYFPVTDFSNSRYLSPLDPPHIWRLLFDSGHFYESRAGVSGFHWLPLLLAATIAGWRQPQMRQLALLGGAGALLIYSAQSYLRYLLPALALLIPAYAAGASLSGRRLGPLLVLLLTAGHLAYQPNANWILRNNAVFGIFASMGRSDALREVIAPELRLIEATLAQQPEARILATSPERPFGAGYAGHVFTTSWYDTELRMAFGSGAAEQMQFVLSYYAFTHVLLGPDHRHAEREALLQELGAQLLQRNGQASIWRLPDSVGPRIELLAHRDRSLASKLIEWREDYRRWHRERKLRHPERYARPSQ